eukprot:CAMPEP_0119362618 /NCGR_PEP_ID=MMETSP1334-20130426/9626_1 /TAXON_ID=127549 /ORGANISM="Calcidiscus leptoporus, Strain RCC1130" /LENGTH=151 /DNA_ID=CAMNT_0007377847 /DNA_START=219 /DNA_END=670 /DNA_ORIENTATION=+
MSSTQGTLLARRKSSQLETTKRSTAAESYAGSPCLRRLRWMRELDSKLAHAVEEVGGLTRFVVGQRHGVVAQSQLERLERHGRVPRDGASKLEDAGQAPDVLSPEAKLVAQPHAQPPLGRYTSAALASIERQVDLVAPLALGKPQLAPPAT